MIFSGKKAKVGYFGVPWDIFGTFIMSQNVFSGTNTHFSDLFLIGRISLKIMYLAKERESDDSLLGGAYETRTRDPLRDRQIF